jgi:hypothetical protein
MVSWGILGLLVFKQKGPGQKGGLAQLAGSAARAAARRRNYPCAPV